MKEVYKELKRRAEQLAVILFYVASGLSFIYYVGNFGGGFLPVMGNLFTMILRVAILLVVPVLLSIGKKPAAKWAFLGVSAYWVITSLFDLLDETGVAQKGAGALAGAMGTFAFLIACALIVTTVFAVLSKVKDSQKWKLIALAIFCVTLLLFVVFFALCTALYAKWKIGIWNIYFVLINKFLVVPFAMFFAALNFWFDGSELDSFGKKFGKKKPGASNSVNKEESGSVFLSEPEEDEAGYEDAETTEELIEEAPEKKETKKSSEKKPLVREPEQKKIEDVPVGKDTEKNAEKKASAMKEAPELSKEKEHTEPAPAKAEEAQPAPLPEKAEKEEPVAFETEFEEIDATENLPAEAEKPESEPKEEQAKEKPEEKPEEKSEEKPEEKTEADEEDDFLKAFLED